MKFLVAYVVVILATLVSSQYEIPMCSIQGEDYTTFDGKQYRVSGDRDAHYLIKGDELIVEVDNKCHGTCSPHVPRALTIRTKQSKITLRNDVHVNGVYKQLPWNSMTNHQDIKITETATKDMIVDLWNGILIDWKKGSYLHIRVPTRDAQHYMMRQHGFKGMCGIFNNDPSDDFNCPRGGLAPSASYFAHAWRTKDHELPAALRH